MTASEETRHLVSSKVIAQMLGCTPKHVGRMIETDGLPVAIRGRGRSGHKFDLARVHAWDVRRQIEKQMPDAEEVTLDRERLRLTTEQADEKAIRNAEDRGDLIRKDHIRHGLMSVLAIFRSGLRGMGGRCADDLAAEDEPAVCKRIIQTEADAILTQCADKLGKLGDLEPPLD